MNSGVSGQVQVPAGHDPAHLTSEENSMAAGQVLVIDVGNTRTKLGVFDLSRMQPLRISAVRPDQNGSVLADMRQWWKETGLKLPSRCVIAGSNPPVRDKLIRDWPWPDISIQMITSSQDVPLILDVTEPSTVGIDRLLTALAAVHLFSEKRTTVVIDSGTATTVNLITSDGVFRGGSILPGLRLSAYALHDYTARLPLIDTDDFGRVPDKDLPLPGRNTDEAISAGLFWGQLGAIREIAGRLETAARQKFGDNTTPVRLLTGGGGRQLVSYIHDAVYVDSLALYGLALLACE